MIPKKNKGAALIVVIVVMAVMTILGASILNISLSQTMQASNEDKRIQAHYLARSGAEATLSAWEDADGVTNPKPSGNCKTVYLDNSNNFQFNYVNPPTNTLGQFDVNVAAPAKQGDNTVVTSVGTVGNVKQTVTATITTTVTQITDPSGNIVSGDSSSAGLGWYDNSGQANVDGKDGTSGETVLVNPKMLKIENQIPTYVADTIKFDTDFQNFKQELTLNAGMLIFINPITTWKHGGSLLLKVLPRASVTRSDKPGQWGRIEYNSQWYYYSDNTSITTDADFNNLNKVPVSYLTIWS